MTAPTLIRWATVEAMTDLKRPHLRKLIRDGKFPAPVRLSTKSVVFSRTAVEDWIKSKLAAVAAQ